MAISKRTLPSKANAAIEAWRLIRNISHNPVAMAACHQVTKETGLPLAPQRALLVFPTDQTLTMRELAGRLGCDNSYVTSLIDALEDRHLAARQPHPSDRRVKVIALTAAGRRVAERLQLADVTPPVSFGNLTESEMRKLRDLLAKVDLA